MNKGQNYHADRMTQSYQEPFPARHIIRMFTASVNSSIAEAHKDRGIQAIFLSNQLPSV
jgi:hypothetical protein